MAPNARRPSRRSYTTSSSTKPTIMDDADQTDHLPSQGFPLTSLRTPDVPHSPTVRSSAQSQFIKCIKQNDIAGVKRLFSGPHCADPNDCDEMGRSAFIIAVDHNLCAMIQCLLELGLDPGDALFHAVETHSVSAVHIICSNLPITRKQEVLNRFPITQSWPSTCKPLILAARQDNFKIVQTLIQQGAEMPSFDQLRSQVEDDSYGQFLALLHWYEAVSNESYILLTSDDPMDTIFNIGKSLDKLEDLMKVPRFKQDCDRIEANLATLSTKLLSLARNHKEVELLLTGGVREAKGRPLLPRRIQQALDIDFKEFVSHPSSQDYMVSQWEVSSPYVLYYTKSRIMSALLYSFLIVFFYIPCILYILLPVEKLSIMQRPFVRFMLHLASRLYFLLLLILSTIRPEVVVLNHVQATQENLTIAQKTARYIHYRSRPWDAFTVLIIIWIVGMTFRTVSEIWAQGRKRFLKSWSLLDSLQLVLYWIFIVMSIVAYIRAVYETKSDGFLRNFTSTTKARTEVTTAPPDQSDIPDTPGGMFFDILLVFGGQDDGDDIIFGYYGNKSRYDWHEFDPLLIAEAAFAVANVLTYLHLIHSFLILAFLGPLLISFRGMTVDVVKFFIIFIFVLISFSLGMTQLYRTFEALDLQTCLRNNLKRSECPQTPFLSFWHSMQSLFWSLFNLIDLVNLAVDDDLHFTESIGSLLYATYMLIAVVVLLNALIAMMSNTYTRVEENSEVEWKVARTRLMGEYMTPSVTLPPPFNLIPTVKSVLRLVRLFRRKCCNHKGVTSSQPGHGSPTLSDTKDAYKVLSLALAERCRRASQIEQVKRKHESKGKQEMAALKMAVDTISQEMKELRLLIEQQISSK